VDGAQQLVARTPCANGKDYLHCWLSLEKAMTPCTTRRPRPLLEQCTSKRNRDQDIIVNSRIALRNAQALAGSCAFVRVLPLSTSALPYGQSLDHRESEDRPHPGGCCA
jgi:uncharacterized protein (UPF0128 family)